MSVDGYKESGQEPQLLREYVKQGMLMQICTVSRDGAPWLAHCWYAADRDLNLIFMSKNGRRHSKEILENGRVAGGIIAIQLEGLGQKVRGVTYEGVAKAVESNDLDTAYSTYSGRWPQVEDMVSIEKIRAGESDNRLWRIEPSVFVLFDEINFPEDPRRELRGW